MKCADPQKEHARYECIFIKSERKNGRKLSSFRTVCESRVRSDLNSERDLVVCSERASSYIDPNLVQLHPAC
jgi:hypothetical protein